MAWRDLEVGILQEFAERQALTFNAAYTLAARVARRNALRVAAFREWRRANPDKTRKHARDFRASPHGQASIKATVARRAAAIKADPVKLAAHKATRAARYAAITADPVRRAALQAYGAARYAARVAS